MSESGRTSPLRIAVLGAGRVGGTLGRRWAELGHDVVFGVRDPGRPRPDLGPAPLLASPADAVRGADIVLVSLPWAATEDVLRSVDVGSAVVVDATNPLAAGARELQDDPRLSGAELVAGWTGSRRVTKAFNTTGSANMADPRYPGATPVLPIAGDDAEAKVLVAALARSLGLDPVDAGPLAAARDLEHLAALWIRLAYPLGNGPDIAFALLRRTPADDR